VSDRRLAGSGWRVPATVPATPGRVPDSRSDPACGWCATIPSDFAVVSSVRRRLANWLEHRTVERGSRRSRFSLYEHWSTPQSTLTKGDWATSNSPLSAPTITSSSPSPTTVGDPTAPGNRGRGLPLMYRLADDVTSPSTGTIPVPQSVSAGASARQIPAGVFIRRAAGGDDRKGYDGQVHYSHLLDALRSR
jgi:hypothetical protein